MKRKQSVLRYKTAEISSDVGADQSDEHGSHCHISETRLAGFFIRGQLLCIFFIQENGQCHAPDNADAHEQCDRGKCLRCHFRSRQCAHSHLLRCCLRHLGLIMQCTDHGQSKPRPGCSQTSRQGDDTQQDPHTGQQGKGRTGDDRTLHFRGIHTECLPGAVCPHQKNHTDHRHKSNDPSTDQVHRYTV